MTRGADGDAERGRAAGDARQRGRHLLLLACCATHLTLPMAALLAP